MRDVSLESYTDTTMISTDITPIQLRFIVMTATKTPKTYYDADHGVEIFPRRRAFTTAEKRWRKKATIFLAERQETSSAVPRPASLLRESQATYKLSAPPPSQEAKKRRRWQIREDLTGILKTLRVVNAILKVQYGSPDWGNKSQVIDELVYILLTRRSKIENAQKQFQALKETYATWQAAAFAPPAELKGVIMGGGLEDEKVRYIQGSLQAIFEKFGRLDEADLAGMSDEQLDEFLRQLPGVSQKTADCVLMYVRDVDIFPVDTHCLRVIDRLGLFKPFGFNWEQNKNHKEAQKVLRSLLIPPHMRGDLHRNLLALGQEVCKPKPLCHRCELRKFCAFYRHEQQKAYASLEAPIAIDMFCGAGGFSIGLRRAGFKIVAAVDNDPDAIRTYRLNHPEMPDEAIIEDDAHSVDVWQKLEDLLDGQTLDLLVGGPPCQGFSLMGNRVPHKFLNGNKKFGNDYVFEEDDRNHLFEAMIEVVAKLRPRYVVIENVPGLASAEIEEKSYAEHIAEWLHTLDYEVEVIRLEAVNFGIPQKRHRYFIFGVRQGEKPLDLAELENKSLSDDDKTKLKHALYDLPQLSVSDGKWISAHQDSADQDSDLYQPYLGAFKIRGATKILFNHVSRYNNEDDITLYSNLKQGETYRQLVERLTEELGETPYFTKYDTKNFEDKYYRLEWEGQSKTIVSHLHKDGNSFVHPEQDQDRSLSVREAARIQSFPDAYIFCGSRGPQFIQIGNAVPPIMGEAIGKIIIRAVRGGRKEE